jgi:hypothetical protein
MNKKDIEFIYLDINNKIKVMDINIFLCPKKTKIFNKKGVYLKWLN